jgi:hypothetical protein
MKPIADPDLAMFVETPAGETVAAALAVPDINQALARVRDGRLLPLGWLRLLAARRRIDSARILLLGVRPEYETRAVGPLLYSALIQRLASKPGMVSAEASWTLAADDKINKAISAIGASHQKTWRVYKHRAADIATAVDRRGGDGTQQVHPTSSGGVRNASCTRYPPVRRDSPAGPRPRGRSRPRSR